MLLASISIVPSVAADGSPARGLRLQAAGEQGEQHAGGEEGAVAECGAGGCACGHGVVVMCGSPVPAIIGMPRPARFCATMPPRSRHAENPVTREVVVPDSFLAPEFWAAVLQIILIDVVPPATMRW